MNQPSPIVNAPRRRRPASDFLRLRHLRLLQLVQQGGSLAAAARELHLSQPAVTKMLQELEAAFGVALVERGARGGSLTPQGEAALQRLRLALEQVDTAIGAASSPRADVPTLRVGILPMVGSALMPGVLLHLRKLGAQVRLSLRESTADGLLKLLADGAVDCVLGRAEPEALEVMEDAQVKRLTLLQDQLTFACAAGHPLARKRRLDLSELAGQEWILAGKGTHTRRQVDALFLNQGLAPPAPIVESMSFHTNLQLVHAVGACTAAPLSAVNLYARMGLVLPLRIEHGFSTAPLSLIYLAAADSLPVLRTFLKAARAAAAEL